MIYLSNIKAIKCGSFIDGTSAAAVSNMVILIDGPIIKWVGEEADTKIPDDAQVIDASGKTYLADALVKPLRANKRRVIRASIDGFHNPKDTRYRLGPDSPVGYYRDSFNTTALISKLLKPLGPGGSLQYHRRVFNHLKDRSTESPAQMANPGDILLCDGVFLHQPVLLDFWDISIFLQVEYRVALSRALARDLPENASTDEISAHCLKYSHRYFPGQRIYLAECQPMDYANVIVDNNDFLFPRLVKFTPCTSS